MCSEESDIGFQIGALGVIGFLYATVSVCVLYPWFGWTNTFFAHEAGLTFFCVMIVYNYMSAAFTDPGSVPVNYEPDDLDIEQGLGSSDREDIARKRRARFCKRCQEYKPPRTHHCSTCGKCVLKMDHHCPWVCNCIGHNNHRYFILFLLYVTTGVGYAMVMCFIRAVQLMGMPTRERRNVPIVTAVAIGLDIFLGLVVLLGVGMLFFFQVSVIFRNMTTIESWEFDTQTRRARRKGKTHRHQYDLGTWNNLKSFFGPNPWTWWLPGKPPGTGVSLLFVLGWGWCCSDTWPVGWLLGCELDGWV